MKNKKIKEIRLNLTDTHKFSPNYFNRTFPQDGQADSYFNRYATNKKIINHNEEIEDEKLLKDTENLIKEISIMSRLQSVGSHLWHRHAPKIAKMIPILDIMITAKEVYEIASSFYNSLNNINTIISKGPSIENIIDTPEEEEIFLKITSPEEEDIYKENDDQKLNAIEIFNYWLGPDEEKYDHFYLTVYFLDGKTKRELRKEIETIAGEYKRLIISLLTGVDTIVGLVGLLGGPAVLVTELGAQLTSTAVAFILDSLTIERLILDLGGNATKTEDGKKILSYLAKIADVFSPSIRTELENVPLVGKKIIEYIENLENQGGQFLSILLQNPSHLFIRIAEIYELTDIDDPNPYARFAQESLGGLVGNAPEYALKTLLASALAKANAAGMNPDRIDPTAIIEEIELAIIENELDIPYVKAEAEDLLRDMIAQMQTEVEMAQYLDENFAKQKNRSLLLLMENFLNKDEDEETFEEIDLSEFSSSGAISGYSLSLGSSNRTDSERKDHHKLLEKQKEVNEQIERMRILEAYHQRTSNRLK